jgi:predicted phosphodiesterase
VADRLSLSLPGWAKGVLVVADVHGHPELFQAMIALAETENRFLMSLGDLVDRGPDNAAPIRQMLQLLAGGRGLFIRGNHDDKLYRTLKGNPTIVDSDLAVTIEQLDAAADGARLKKRFSEAYRAAPFIVTIGQTVLVHGGMAPAMLKSRSLPAKLKALALYGEASRVDARRKPIRTYRWLDAVPSEMTVVIGHHPISDRSVLVRTNGAGGRLLHLDCGAGKGRGLGALRVDLAGRVTDACRAFRDNDLVDVEPIPLIPIADVAEQDDLG